MLEFIFNYIVDNQIYLIVIYLLVGVISIKLINSLIIKGLSIKTKNFDIDNKKEHTLASVLTNIVKYFVWFAVAIGILEVLGFSVSTLIAGAGILGVALSFGAQDLVKDVISGFFIIFENHYNIGDTVKVGDFKGTVVSFGLKSTRIKNWVGEEKIVSNRDMKNVINYSINESVAIVDVRVSYEANLKEVESILTEYAKTEESEMLTGPVELLGVQELDESAVVFRLIGRTVPMKHFGVKRQMRMNIKNLFDEKGIEIPFPQVTINEKITPE